MTPGMFSLGYEENVLNVKKQTTKTNNNIIKNVDVFHYCIFFPCTPLYFFAANSFAFLAASNSTKIRVTNGS